MNSQLERWIGKFGDEYTQRSMISPDVILKRAQVFMRIFTQLDRNPISILEVGCNLGANLMALKSFLTEPYMLVGIEPNEIARRIGQIHGYPIYPDCGQKLSFLDGFFNLVFTCGVLIHCELNEAEKIVQEMRRVSNGLLMFMEYFSVEDMELPYRHEKKMLWARPWPIHFKAWGLGDPIFFGFIPEGQGFDDVHWWLYFKAGN